MSEYNAKNYTEQGGDVTHIGGRLVFDEGAETDSLPSSAFAYVVDLENVDLSNATTVPVDITIEFPIETFRKALTGDKPVLIKNARWSNTSSTKDNVYLTSSNGRNSIIGVGYVVNTDSATLLSIISILISLSDDGNAVMASANQNTKLSAVLNP